MNEFFSKVFRWFGIGLLVTFLVGFFVSTNLTILSFLFTNMWIIFLVEIFIGFYLSSRIYKMDVGLARGLYIGYTALTGLTFSTIFIVYEIESIIWIFLATSLIFVCFSIIGNRMNVDFRKMGVYLMVFLFALIILEIVNIFIMSHTLNMIACVLGLAIFVAYVAYDIKKLDYYEDNEKFAIIGAFHLYLDFINIFLKLLRLFGRRRD